MQELAVSAWLVSAAGWIVPLVAAVVTGLLSYNYWLMQQIKREQHEHALTALKALLAVREQLRRARSPFMTGGEASYYRKKYEYSDLDCENAEKSTSANFQKIGYSGRMIELHEKYGLLRISYLEMEALVGERFLESLAELDACIVDFYTAVSLIINSEEKLENTEEYKRERSRVYASVSSNQKNELTDRIDAAINEQELLLRGKLLSQNSRRIGLVNRGV